MNPAASPDGDRAQGFRWSALGFVLGAVALVAGASPQCDPVHRAKLTSEPSVESAWFGQSVGLSGAWAIVGAPGAVGIGPESGSADIYLWKDSAWKHVAAIAASDEAAGAEFGFAVAMSGDWAVVGAPGKVGAGADVGGAYIYAWNGLDWVERAVVAAPAGIAGDRFGSSVAIQSGGSGDRVVIGAPGDDQAGAEAGAAHVFRRAGNSWVYEARLAPDGGNPGQGFGLAVGIAAGDATDVTVVGAPGYDGFGLDAGGAYAFKREGFAWTSEGMLPAPEPTPGAHFGESVAAVGAEQALAVIGAPDEAGGGAAYVFERAAGVWGGAVELTPEGEDIEAFGAGVAVAIGDAGTVIVVGAPGSETVPGAALVFRRVGGGWPLEAEIQDDQDGAMFGDSVSVSVAGDEGRALVGAPRDDQIGSEAGSAEFYGRHMNGWTSEEAVYPRAPADREYLGRELDISGDWAIAGTRREDPKERGPGAAHLYRREGLGWVHHSTLLPEPESEVDWYGFSVALITGPEGDWAFVAAYDGAQSAGQIEVYRLVGDEWTREATLKGLGTGTGDSFGTPMAVCRGPGGDRLVAGAGGWDLPNKFDAGAAFVFRRDGLNWVEEATITASDPQSQVDYADAISIASGPGGDLIAIGCPGDNTKANRSGAAYVYRREGSQWIQEQKIIPPDATWYDNFGFYVTIDSKPGGDRLIATSAYDDDKGDSTGSAYVYVRSGQDWEKEAKLVAADGAAGDAFGSSFVLTEGPDGLIAAVGSPWYDGGARAKVPDSGGVYLFRKEEQGWVPTGIIRPSDPEKGALFGLGMAGDDSAGGPRLLVGAPHDDANGFDSGAAYALDLCPAACYADLTGEGVLDIFDFLAFVNLFNDGQTQADCDVSGSLDLFDFLCFVTAFNVGC